MTPQIAHFESLAPLEYILSDQEFQTLCALVKTHTGIHLTHRKRELVHGRLARRLRALNLGGFGDYIRTLRAPDSAEVPEFRNAITTNLTSFFREAHHFEFLADRFSSWKRVTGKLRFWCAGCSTGEEPYSLAMTLLETLPSRGGLDIRILATDIDSSVLSAAQHGVYPADRLAGVSKERLARFFERTSTSANSTFRVRDSLRELVTFKSLNLTRTLPMKGPFDAVFCRNVMIYFDAETQRSLIRRITVLQRAGDCLFLGHAESPINADGAYKPLGKTIYMRV